MDGSVLMADILCNHLRSDTCDYRNSTEETVDLSQFLPNDLLLIVDVCSQLKGLKYLYIKQQYNS